MSKLLLSDLSDKLRRTYHLMLETGGVTCSQLITRFRTDFGEIFEAAKDRLAEIGLRVIAQRLLRGPVRIQVQYDLFALPSELRPFARRQISVPTSSESAGAAGREVKWIAFPNATFPDLLGHVGLLADGIEADRQRLLGLADIMERVRPVMEQSPTMTMREGLAELGRRQSEAA